MPYRLRDDKGTFKVMRGAAAGIASGRIHELLASGPKAGGEPSRGDMDEDYFFCEHVKARMRHNVSSLPAVLQGPIELEHLLSGDAGIQAAYLELDKALGDADLTPVYAFDDMESWPFQLQLYILAAAAACQAVMEQLAANYYARLGITDGTFPIID